MSKRGNALLKLSYALLMELSHSTPSIKASINIFSTGVQQFNNRIRRVLMSFGLKVLSQIVNEWNAALVGSMDYNHIPRRCLLLA
jgi:hypothetical protein